MEYILIGIAGSAIWMAFEMWRAPHIDEQTGRTIEPIKKLKDLFKKK
jgi:hypothetical protein